MKTIKGQFRNIHNDLIDVTFVNQSGTGTVTIGENGLLFGGDPVNIVQDNEDTFAHILMKSAEINLVANRYVGDLFFANNSRSVSVTITNLTTGEVLFYGFVTPNTFDQSFTRPLDEFTVNCIDALSTLQYYNYKKLTVNNYEANKKTIESVSFYDLLIGFFDNDILQGRLLYDHSKAIEQGRENSLFSDLKISESILYGEDADSIMTEQAILEEMLRYLNLHISQEGYNYYIYDWESVKSRNVNMWRDIINNSNINCSQTIVPLINTMHADDASSITISDVYNQIQVKCELEGEDTVIESPLTSDSLSTPYEGRQHYMTEYRAVDVGFYHGANTFMDMVNGQRVNGKEFTIREWYFQVLQNVNWKLYLPTVGTIDSLFSKDSEGRYHHQWGVPYFMSTTSVTPCFYKFGYVEIDGDKSDNSPINSITMNDALYISINGNEDDSEQDHYPSDTYLDNCNPIIEYIGQNSGGVLSPVDDNTTNYLIFSGKLQLQAIQPQSMTYDEVLTKEHMTISTDPAQIAEDMRYFPPVNVDGKFGFLARKFYNMEFPDSPESHLPVSSMVPSDGKGGNKEYQYHYSEAWNHEDLISKLSVLECELIIGNKRLIESNIDEWGNSTFSWVELGQEPTIEDEDGNEYPLTTFSLGINPKIDDYIIDTEYDIQNTVDYRWGLSGSPKGTAIPIKKSDNLSGAVIFRILGPIQTVYNHVTRRHPLFSHSKWRNNDKYLLAHTQNIVIKDFTAKIYTNSGGYDNTKNDDLIYMSAETNNYINKKDDITFKFITQLNSQECNEKGIKNGVNINAVIDATTNNTLISLYNAKTDETAKAEEHYVDAYYREYSTPRIIYNANLHNASNITPWNVYSSATLSKQFMVQSTQFNVKRDNKTLTLKEI